MRGRYFMMAVMGAALFSPSRAICQAPVTPEVMQARFDHEPDVNRRARLLIDMSQNNFKMITNEVQQGENDDALKLLRQLDDDAQRCSRDLDAKEANPEAHPGGFKQLQIATRESLRRLDDIILTLAGDEQTPFLTIRTSFDELNRHLIRELFPHQPQSETPTGATPSAPR